MSMALLLIAALAGPPVASPAPTVTTLPLRVSPAGLPMVRVEVTEERSAWFVLDTGATGTTVHDRLADQLRLPAAGEATMGTVTGRTTMALVRVPSLGFPGLAAVHDVVAGSHAMTSVRQAAPEAEGIIGQDVLGAHDYLIDFVRRVLVIGTFPPPRGGRGVDVRWSAGRPVLLFAGERGTQGLVLDSGADALVMERRAARDAVGDEPPATRGHASLRTHNGARMVEVEHHASLRLARLPLTRVALVRLPAEAWRLSPEVGLLPAALFAKVYVSARRGEAVLWPR